MVAALPGTYLIRELKLTNLVPVATGVASTATATRCARGTTSSSPASPRGSPSSRRPANTRRSTTGGWGCWSRRRVSWQHVARYAADRGGPAPPRALAARCSGRARSGGRWPSGPHSLAREVAERERAVEELRLNQAPAGPGRQDGVAGGARLRRGPRDQQPQRAHPPQPADPPGGLPGRPGGAGGALPGAGGIYAGRHPLQPDARRGPRACWTRCWRGPGGSSGSSRI